MISSWNFLPKTAAKWPQNAKVELRFLIASMVKRFKVLCNILRFCLKKFCQMEMIFWNPWSKPVHPGKVWFTGVTTFIKCHVMGRISWQRDISVEIWFFISYLWHSSHCVEFFNFKWDLAPNHKMALIKVFAYVWEMKMRVIHPWFP